MEKAIKIIEEVRRGIIEKYALADRISTRNNIIFKNDEVVLVQNKTTGDIKLKRNLR